MAERSSGDFDFWAWRNRMAYLAEHRIPIEAKGKIARNLLRTQVRWSTEEDADLFFDPEFSPNTADVERSLRYAKIEDELRRGFDGDIDHQELVRRIQAHHDGIVPILIEYFTEDEIRELCLGHSPQEITLDPAFMLFMVGHESLWGRRVRNSYLRGMVTLLSVDPANGVVEDLSHQIFDGEEDAVDTMNRLMGKDPPKDSI